MTIIADGGSTKCDWILLDESGNLVLKTRTSGLNPAVVPQEDLYTRIRENNDLPALFGKATHVDFYGAGCGTETPRTILRLVLEELFVNATVTVQEDMMAAVYAATSKPGIICILGTGSNSCYYDGTIIHTPIASLGFTLMDEASGNYFGKRLIRDYFYKRMPVKLAEEFEKRFDLDADTIKQNLYQKPNPNTYLAQFAEFIFTSEEVNGYFYKLISEGIIRFIDYRIMCYKEAQSVPIHFVGSIAHFSKDIIEDCMKRYQLELGNVIRRPIDGLIDYYRNHRLNITTQNS